MGKYDFKTSRKVEVFCNKIVEELQNRFKIVYEEAFDRVNQKWNHIGFITAEDDLIFHHTVEEWALIIYFGPDSEWWKDDISDLIPLPYKPPK